MRKFQYSVYLGRSVLFNQMKFLMLMMMLDLFITIYKRMKMEESILYITQVCMFKSLKLYFSLSSLLSNTHCPVISYYLVQKYFLN